MAHTKSDVMKAEQDYYAAADMMVKIYAGKIEAIQRGIREIENGKRAVSFRSPADDDVLTLHDVAGKTAA